MMKKVLKWVGIAFVVLIAIGIFAGGGKQGSATQKSDSAAEQAPEKKDQPERAVYKTTAKQLFADYESNEVAADKKMKGALIEVSGTVQSIDKDFTDSIVIKLSTSNEFMPAQMGVEDSQKSQAIALKKGAKVVMRCEKMSRMAGSPSGRDCVFAE